jgi:hypothetical protein
LFLFNGSIWKVLLIKHGVIKDYETVQFSKDFSLYFFERVKIYWQLLVTIYTPELAYLPMTTIAILAILAILGGVATLSVTGFTVISPTAAQTPTGDNTSMTGNMTGGNVTGGNMTGSISSFGTEEESGDGTGGGDESGSSGGG